MDVVRTPATGWIEVIVGSMFSGKSEELIRRLRRAQIARQRVQIFKPAVDTRYADRPHRLAQRAADSVRERADAPRICWRRCEPDTEVVGIDEGQFFDAELPAVVHRAGAARRARDRRRPRPGLPRQAVRADAAAAGDRGVHHQDARHLHGLRQPAPITRSASWAHRSRAARRAGHLRGALPALLRPDPGGSRRAEAEDAASPGEAARGSRDDAASSLPRRSSSACSPWVCSSWSST